MKIACRIAAFSLVIPWLPTEATVAGKPINLAAKPLRNKLGLALNDYSFSWSVPAQAGYRILVASGERELLADVGDLWNSGLRHSGQNTDVIYRGSALTEVTDVWWKVRVWQKDGSASDWSAPASFTVTAAESNLRPVPRPTSASGKIQFIEGRIGKALKLGSAARIIVRDYDELRSTAGTTIAAWIKPEKTPDAWQSIYRKEDGARRLLSIGKTGAHWGVWFGLVIDGKYVEFCAPYDRMKLSNGNWHHVAASFDGMALCVYVDGEKIGEKKRRGTLNRGDNTPAFIGSYNGSGEYFYGAIDDLRVYSRGLSAKDVGSLATVKPEVMPPGLAGHWAFDGSVANAATFIPETGSNRIVLLGGTLIYGMEQHGFFETSITARWPHHDITFRNLGWPADDVFGTARGEFGSAQNTRSWQPPGSEFGFGFSELLKQVRDSKPTTLIVGYGAEAAYANSDKKMRNFEDGYRNLIRELETTHAQMVLLTPIPQQKAEIVLPDPKENNNRLLHAARFILKTAVERGHIGIDLFGEDIEKPGSLVYESAINLAPEGYRLLAGRLVRSLGLADESLLTISEVNGRISTNSDTLKTGAVIKTKRGQRLDLTLDRLPSVASAFQISNQGKALNLWHDRSQIQHIAERSGSVEISGGPDFQQAERLRRLVIEKNTLYRHKLRPINKTYIFLFRRHEMGHLAREMDDIEELVAGKEELIAHVRVPLTNRYELRHPDQWHPPRAYPDHEVPKNIPKPNINRELEAFTIAEGFELNLFAANPMIANPINLNWDTRGRAWVSTSTTYPHIKPGHEPNDRIIILEDHNGDGVAEKHTVFADGLTVPHSVMPAEGGAYVCSTTKFLFLEDSDGDDICESRRVIYSGFGNADVHHMIHGLRWAPWGDLYFTQSIYINTFVETPHGPRRMNGSGIWRFEPDTEQLDAFAHGMVNPWGFAFDYWGQSFGTDGAGGAGPHYVFPGAAFRSAVGFHRVLDGLIPGKPKNTAAEFVSGHHMPEHWHGSLLANDFRANRTVRYELKENSSGYTAKEVETVLHSKHRSFRPVDIKMGPDGAVYVVDWYNPIIDHGEVDFHHPLRDKSHGRIWRITAKNRPLLKRETIAGAQADDLLAMLKDPGEYTRSQARRELALQPPRKMLRKVSTWLKSLDQENPRYEHHRLEALWLVVALRAPYPELAAEVLRSSSPQVRSAAVRAISNWSSRAGHIDRHDLLATAVEDQHPRVRLEAISALRELGTLEAANIALRALTHETDNNISFALELAIRDLRDQWLPAMQSGRPVFDGDPSRLAFALKEVGDPRAIAPLVKVMTGGGIAAADLAQAATTIAALGEPADLDAMLAMSARKPELLAAIAKGAATNPNVPGKGQSAAGFLESSESTVRSAAARLCGIWKISGAREKIIALATTGNLGAGESFTLCETLSAIGAINDLQKLSAPGQPPVLRVAAVAAWAKSNPRKAATPATAILTSLDESGTTEAEALFSAFISHSEGPAALANSVSAVKLKQPVSIAGIRIARASGREMAALISALNLAGGLKPLAQNLSKEERRVLLADAEKSGNTERGRDIYHRKVMLCTNCHMIDNQGGKLGPDLSTVGSYMTPESLLESIINPSTAIKQGYETVIVATKAKAVITGLLQRKTETSLLLRDPTGRTISIHNSDIANIDTSPVSLMPPGLTATLRRDEILDLMRYLVSLKKTRS